MITDTLGVQLHDRATRGLQLSTEEQLALAQWYQFQDNQEAEQFASGNKVGSLAPIRSEIAAVTARLREAAVQIDTLTAQNDALQHEIIVLQNQLPPHTIASPS